MSDLQNPYSPPQSDVSPPGGGAYGDDLDLVLDASAGTRFVNLLVDSICRLIFAFMGGMVCGILGIDMRGPGASILFALTTVLVYYIGLEGLFGFTIGKLVTGTRVVDENGQKPSFGAIVGRTFARFVPFEPFSFLGDTRGWHDRWSGTRVVKVRR